MPDMLVKLYELPEQGPARKEMEEKGVTIRRAIAPEKHLVVRWIRENFNEHWVSEAEAAFANRPISCHIALVDGKLAGFSCHDATCKAFFGPTGVGKDQRGLGIGKALLMASLHDMWANGYAYAIIGGAGPVDFYAKTVGATIIEGSVPGIYRGMLRE